MDLELAVEKIKGIGPKTTAILNKAGIFTLKDLLYTLPRDYENYQTPTKISQIRPGKVVVKGKISQLTTRHTARRRLTITEGVIRDQTDAIRVVWFNQPYRTQQFIENKEYYFSGVYEFNRGRYQLTSPSACLASDVEKQDNFQPIYIARSKLKSNFFKRIFNHLRPDFTLIPDLLPPHHMAPAKTRAESLFKVHFPANDADVAAGRKYLAYEELFQFILAAKLNQAKNQQLTAKPLEFSAKKTQQLVAQLPFKLTNAQRRAAWDILQDLARNTPMNRLLQGDVGSGKTAVAALAIAQTAWNHQQAVFLAPTAILATQHFETLKTLLAPFNFKIALLTGATKAKTELKAQIASGEIDLVIGTHAVLTDDTVFHSLALCIIDEQHRFGVNQRQKLLLKSPPHLAPHLLTMTATPIPRSLQLTVFGDLDISIINELPKGRQPITTQILSEVNQNDTLYPKMREIMQSGQQIYWICRAIEDQSEVVSVKKRAKRLQEVFPGTAIEFLHGRLKPAEKDAIMTRFANHQITILVSTTVVEVGVDVPNASLIIIEDAENYGLAALHQLRGRVGRGSQPSFCYLLTSGDQLPSRRLRELEKSTDGFYLAEVDLKLRGPGEIYGSLQHGALNLRIATLSDTKLIAAAERSVSEFIRTEALHAQNSRTKTPNMLQYQELATAIKKYQQLTTLN